MFTLILAILFTGLQGFEYVNAPFNIVRSLWFLFYMATGFMAFTFLLVL
jgi:heme/copper-type cytochrome/quinol oxidase subunit 3